MSKASGESSAGQTVEFCVQHESLAEVTLQKPLGIEFEERRLPHIWPHIFASSDLGGARASPISQGENDPNRVWVLRVLEEGSAFKDGEARTDFAIWSAVCRHTACESLSAEKSGRSRVVTSSPL